MNNGKPEAIWATKVDKAGPITPKGVKRTKIKSNATLMVVEIIRKVNGVFESPLARRIAADRLYSERKTRPDKTIYK